jgi:hypothetical protein
VSDCQRDALHDTIPEGACRWKLNIIFPLFSCTQDKESWDLNNEEKIEAAGKKKEEGNVLFKLGKYARASKRYEKVWHFYSSFVVVFVQLIPTRSAFSASL